MLPCCQRSIGREMRCFPGFLSSPLCFAVVSVLREKAPVNLESLSARRCVGSVNRRRPSSIGVRIRARMERRREDGLGERGLELPSRQGSSTTKQASKPTTTELTLPCQTDSTSTRQKSGDQRYSTRRREEKKMTRLNPLPSPVQKAPGMTNCDSLLCLWGDGFLTAVSLNNLY